MEEEKVTLEKEEEEEEEEEEEGERIRDVSPLGGEDRPQDQESAASLLCSAGSGVAVEVAAVTSAEFNGDEATSEAAKHRKRRRSADSRASRNSSISSSKLKSLKLIADKAVEHHKTFIIFGRFPSIREALKSRGWVQNCDPHRSYSIYSRHHHHHHHHHSSQQQNLAVKDEEGALLACSPRSSVSASGSSSDGEPGAGGSEDRDSHLISRLLRDAPVNFIWVMGDNVDWKALSKSPIVSRFPRVYFTTKVGLCNYLQQTHWFCEAGISNTLFPRCYNISCDDDLAAFVNDFRLTACISLLNLLTSGIDNGKQLFSEEGKVPLNAVEFAARRCSEYVAIQEHEDIDQRDSERIWDHQWDQFLTWYYQLAHEQSTFSPATDSQKKTLYLCCKLTVEAITPHWPQMHLDGLTNLWIVKPGAKSRGRGIQVMRKLEDIVTRIGNLHSKDPRYVIQKYIERPFLIYNTKFDIRQWFLVTSAYPLTIWMYKESYLRFCSQLFSLSNMHESVHLSNNAVQCKYKNAKRDQALPDENMWDCYTFKTYLRAIGQADMWDKIIYPGMRESITGTLLAAQEHMEQRKNCFELYGADFMLTEDLVPWLIEINSSPCMSPTTSVTARMCAQCLEDVIKVVVDRRQNKMADTGMFELVYRQHVAPPQPYMGMNLTVRGSKIQRSPKTKRRRRPLEPIQSESQPETPLAPLAPSRIRNYIEDLSIELSKELSKTSPTTTLANTLSVKLPNSVKEISLPNCEVSTEEYDSPDSTCSDQSDSESEDELQTEPEKPPLTPTLLNNKTDDSSKITPVKQKEHSTDKENNNTNPSEANVKVSQIKNDQKMYEIIQKQRNLCIKSAERSAKGHQRCVKYEQRWKKACETEQNKDLIHDWKLRVDKTRASCEEMLLKLKAFREKDVTCKIHRGIDWRAADNETVQELVQKLSNPKRKTFMDRLPVVCSRKTMKKWNASQSSSSSSSSQSHALPNYLTAKNSLPLIRHKNRVSLTKDNVYTVGLRLSCQRMTPSPREKIILPMGAEQCHGINLASLSNTLSSKC
ncbi:hypothetical protein LSTR_LSTR004729 [Laodelphax striatellus]|uniref:Tubulin glycylase 3A n=1 Tax=Laodelphax striatellus TaxID=195883 RepID=A0A482XJE3_LAOST|nr:hypothetical protein LSTR_LSTR004729 [Laodelphax striatellus]